MSACMEGNVLVCHCIGPVCHLLPLQGFHEVTLGDVPKQCGLTGGLLADELPHSVHSSMGAHHCD